MTCPKIEEFLSKGKVVLEHTNDNGDTAFYGAPCLESAKKFGMILPGKVKIHTPEKVYTIQELIREDKELPQW